jgi:hypothetical protein
MKIVYIHGFRSGINAHKATLLKDALKDESAVTFESWDYPDDLLCSVEMLSSLVEQDLRKGIKPNLVGASMGGFLSLLLSYRYGLKVALINPCLYPAKFILDNHLIGQTLENSNTHKPFKVTEECYAYVKRYEPELRLYIPEKTMVFLQRGDEVLDYRYALELLSRAQKDVAEGGSHGYDNFEACIPKIMDFFQKN